MIGVTLALTAYSRVRTGQSTPVCTPLATVWLCRVDRGVRALTAGAPASSGRAAAPRWGHRGARARLVTALGLGLGLGLRLRLRLGLGPQGSTSSPSTSSRPGLARVRGSGKKRNALALSSVTPSGASLRCVPS